MSMTTPQSLLEHFGHLLTHLHGDLERCIKKPANSNTQTQDTLIYVGDKKSALTVDHKSIKTVIAHEKLKDWASDQLQAHTVLLTKNVKLSMALINKHFFPITGSTESFDEHKVHPTAVIHPSVKFDHSVVIGPNAVIYKNVVIGKNCIIGSNCTVEQNVTIGDSTHIHANAFIGHDTVIGSNCYIKPNATLGSAGFGFANDEENNHYHLPHYGRLILGNNVFVGAGTTIDRGTYDDSVISDGCIFDSHIHIGHNNLIGKNSILTAGFLSGGSTTIGENFVAGGRSSMAGHVKVCDQVQIAANSTVTKDVEEPGNYAGYPLVGHKQALRYLKTLPHLPEMKKAISELKSKLEDN